MGCNWLKDKENQNNIKAFWKRYKDEHDPKKANYHTKHHTTIQNHGVRQKNVLDRKLNLLYRHPYFRPYHTNHDTMRVY